MKIQTIVEHGQFRKKLQKINLKVNFGKENGPDSTRPIHSGVNQGHSSVMMGSPGNQFHLIRFQIPTTTNVKLL